MNNVIVTAMGRPDLLFDSDARGQAEAGMTARLSRYPHHPLTRLWKRVRIPRNTLAHCGFQTREREPGSIMNLIRENAASFQAALGDDNVWREFWRLPETGKRLLLTPLGTSPGLLLTALVLVRPDVAVVVTSQQAAARIPEAVAAASHGGEVRTALVEDVFGGFREAKDVRRRVAEAVRETLGDEGFEVIVNLTGGTTVLQYLTERAADHFRGRGYDVKRVVMVDRRPHDEQQKTPYIIGEMLELGSESEAELESDVAGDGKNAE